MVYCGAYPRGNLREGYRRKRAPLPVRRYIGAHNGVVDAPARFAVDSQYLIYRLKRCNGDYQAAFDPVDGWWGLSWFDGADFYLQAYGVQVALGKDVGGAWYYSSDVAHLEAAVGALVDVFILDWGDTVRFDCKTRKPEFLTPISPTLDYPFYADMGANSGNRGKSSALVELTAMRLTGNGTSGRAIIGGQTLRFMGGILPAVRILAGAKPARNRRETGARIRLWRKPNELRH